MVLRGGGVVTPIDFIRSFPTGVKVRSSGQGDILGVVKQSNNQGSGKVGEEARQLCICACIVGQGECCGKVKRSTLKFAGQNS